MNLLSVENLSKSYGIKPLFTNFSFGISTGEKVALVAKNGSGKTSLLKILAGKDQADNGTVAMRKEIKLAYLDQDPDFDRSKTIAEVIFEGNSAELAAIKDYEDAIEKVNHDPSEKNLELLNTTQELVDKLNAWDYETRVKQVLSKLAITDLEQTIGTLSGGQKKRVALSKVLVQEPDLLIMDEPTNHLDIEMTEWLEGYLSAREDMALLLVTHDRYFLDNVCTDIIEIDNGQLYRYKGNYTYFIEKKAEREFNEASEIDKARNLYRRELEWIRKMPKARTTKSKSRIDAFDDIKDKALQKKNNDKIEINVKMQRLGGKILELIHLRKSFPSIKVLDNFSYTFISGEKIGIVGKNGVGKTTLLNMIMGKEAPDGGKIQIGDTVVIGYYSQQGMTASDDKRVIEVIKDIAEYIPLADGSKLTASAMLTRFMFAPDTQYGYVGKLSGGEKRRLYLLTILMKNPNFLILDEPTNDLDIVTLNILEEFLHEYAGCVLIVTHDRYFMDRLVDHLFVFEGNGIIKDFPGNYTQYRDSDYYLESKQEVKVEKVAATVEETPVVENIVLPTETKETKRKLTFKEKFEWEQLEKEIPLLEKQKIELQEKLNSPTIAHQDLLEVSSKFEKVSNELDEKGLRWLELSELT